MYAVFVIGRTGDTELRSYANRGAFLDALGLPKTTETWWAVARLYGSVLEIESRADADEVLQIIRHRYPVPGEGRGPDSAVAERLERVRFRRTSTLRRTHGEGTIRGKSGAVTSRAL